MFHSRLAYASCLLILVLLTASVRADTERDFHQTLTTVEIAALVTPSVVTITGELGFGSGVVLDSSGVIVTNHHVIEGEPYLSIALSNGDIYDDVRVLDVDVRRDLAVLKIKAFNLSAVALGDSDDIQVGESVVLVGNPQGYDRTVSEGVVSALRKDPDGYRLIQTSAPISQGSSGGGMFNNNGALIGIVSAAVPDAQNLNFAVPINYARGLTLEGAGMTLVEFANQSGETSLRSDSTAAVDPNEERLLASLQDSLLNWEPVGGFHGALVPLPDSRDGMDVWVTLLDEEIVYFVSYPEELNIELTPAHLKLMLELNYELNLAKVSIDEDGDAVAHAEVRLSSLDALGVDFAAALVANAADHLQGIVGGSATASVADGLGEELDLNASMDSSEVALRNAAMTGHAESQVELAAMYLYGNGVEEDAVEAARWYRLAADQGNADGQFGLGWLYANGLGVPEDVVEAVRWYRLAAQQENAQAQYNLGTSYANGVGVPEDAVRAAGWFRLAAEQGEAQAQYNLGWSYAHGAGVSEDAVEAVRWYRLAADQGDAGAQYNLGWMYSNGAGVPEDAVEAVRWYRLAADQGDPEAQYNLGVIYDDGRGVQEDDMEGVRWYRLAAEQGFAQAQYNLGWMYGNGEGVPEDAVEQSRWFRLAAEQGFALAQYNLGWMYGNGEGVPEDAVEAARWFRLAAEQGLAQAQRNIGFMYANGLGVPEDAVEAVRWLRLAAAQGDTGAQDILRTIEF